VNPDDCWHTEIEKSRCVHCGTICAPSISAYTLANPPRQGARVRWLGPPPSRPGEAATYFGTVLTSERVGSELWIDVLFDTTSAPITVLPEAIEPVKTVEAFDLDEGIWWSRR
jgi:hypothetical protein